MIVTHHNAMSSAAVPVPGQPGRLYLPGVRGLGQAQEPPKSGMTKQAWIGIGIFVGVYALLAVTLYREKPVPKPPESKKRRVQTYYDRLEPEPDNEF